MSIARCMSCTTMSTWSNEAAMPLSTESLILSALQLGLHGDQKSGCSPAVPHAVVARQGQLHDRTHRGLAVLDDDLRTHFSGNQQRCRRKHGSKHPVHGSRGDLKRSNP